MPDLKSAEGQLAYLTDGCIDVVRQEELKARLERSLATGKPLVVKAGFDPSAPDIHLGHVVVIRKMKQFQDCGHQPVFVVGDFTAMIGDPTGRSKTRPQLTREEIAVNAGTYAAQAVKILDEAQRREGKTDFRPTKFEKNSQWLESLGSVGMIKLAAKYNVARMLERRDFRQRYDAGQSISVHEFLYPLAQAYDSVALAADVELGGTDQLFNLNVGRDIMPEYDLAPQVVMTTPLLEGLDGVEKMSKSLGNYVAIEDRPDDMFGKLMSVSDDLMWKYWRLLSGVTSDRIDLARHLARGGEAPSAAPSLDDLSRTLGTHARALGPFHPKSLKLALAHRIVRDFHGAAAADAAEGEFERRFSEGANPSNIEEVTRPLSEEGVWLPKLLAELGLAKSNGEAIRLIQQGGVEVDGRKVESKEQKLEASAPAVYLIKVGKRRVVRVRFSS